MLRKLSLVAIAAAALGAAALAPTSASAWGGGHGHRWHRMGWPPRRDRRPRLLRARPWRLLRAPRWCRHPGVCGGGWSTAATERTASPSLKPRPQRRGFFLPPGTIASLVSATAGAAPRHARKPIHRRDLTQQASLNSSDATWTLEPPMDIRSDHDVEPIDHKTTGPSATPSASGCSQFAPRSSNSASPAAVAG